MACIYYIYQSKNKTEHPFYIGQDGGGQYNRILTHIAAAFNLGYENFKVTNSPAKSNPSSFIKSQGVSNCIFCAFDNPSDCYGVGDNVFQLFLKEGWTVQASNEKLNFAEICHILVHFEKKDVDELTNVSLGGERSEFYFDLYKKYKTLFDAYGIQPTKELKTDKTKVYIHFPDQLKDKNKILYPENYGLYRLLANQINHAILHNNSIWEKLISAWIKDGEGGLTRIIKDIGETEAQKINSYIPDQNMHVSFNNISLKDVVSKLSKKLTERLSLEVVNNNIDAIETFYRIAYNNNALKIDKINGNTVVKNKKRVQSLKEKVIVRDNFIENIVPTNVKEPQWFTLAKQQIKISSNNTLNENSFLTSIIKVECHRIFIHLAQQVINEGTPIQPVRDMNSMLGILDNGIHNIKLSFDKSDWLKTRLYNKYISIGYKNFWDWNLFYNEHMSMWRAELAKGLVIKPSNTISIPDKTEDLLIMEKITLTPREFLGDPNAFEYHWSAQMWENVKKQYNKKITEISWYLL